MAKILDQIMSSGSEVDLIALIARGYEDEIIAYIKDKLSHDLFYADAEFAKINRGLYRFIIDRYLNIICGARLALACMSFCTQNHNLFVEMSQNLSLHDHEYLIEFCLHECADIADLKRLDNWLEDNGLDFEPIPGYFIRDKIWLYTDDYTYALDFVKAGETKFCKFLLGRS